MRAGVCRVCGVHYSMLKPLADRHLPGLSPLKHKLSCVLASPENRLPISLVHHEWGAAEWVTCMSGTSMGEHA